MAGDQDGELREQLAEARARAISAEAQLHLMGAELARVREWWRIGLLAVVAVALLAILMLGVVAFNAIDDDNALRPATVDANL